jgi:hypothetical protein
LLPRLGQIARTAGLVYRAITFSNAPVNGTFRRAHAQEIPGHDIFREEFYLVAITNTWALGSEIEQCAGSRRQCDFAAELKDLPYSTRDDCRCSFEMTGGEPDISRNDGGKIPGATVATRLNRYATPVPWQSA